MAIDLITANPDENNPDTIAVEIDLFVQQLKGSIPQYNAQFAAVNAAVAAAESAVSALANTVWVSGTSYTAGVVRYSPIDFLNYRRKTNGAGTTDPSQDPTNWELQTSTSLGGSETTTSAIDITLTFTSARLQIINMTAAGKKVTNPPASTLKKGTPVFVYKNDGAYRFSVHKNGGGFICYVNPGQVVAVHCSDTSSSAGVWQVSGEDIEQVYSGNNAEVLNAVDSRYLAVAMLSATQAICAFADNVTGYPNAVVLNYGSASGTPAQITNEAAVDISIAAQTNNQATVVYKMSTGVTKAVVLDISSSTFTPGTVRQIDGGTTGRGTSVDALSSTQLLAVYYGASGGVPKMRVLDIASSVITESAEVTADGTNGSGLYLRIRKVSSSKALLIFLDNTNKKMQCRLISITGSIPAQTGSLLDLTSVLPGSLANKQFGMAVLSTTRAVAVTAVDRTYCDFVVSLLDISGSSPVLLRSRVFNVGVTATVHATATKLDANSLYVTWTGGYSNGVDGVRIAITADDNILLGEISENVEPGVTAAGFYVACAGLDSGHVMQVVRNANTYLSARTLELAS
ncbi:hypothetical protein [Nitrosomonas oligotropha]|uniref:hypothetical protein n=1 Tax=Nitrosomonas oligotropha TaxID=42354 RepID=UPI00136CFC66|nr:hypothetical protein [Nitrosomonas oligotropha]MXS81582.1 hypothetical protein [Nitrosomonas oligotropha]